ncbi:MAG TPA: LuxR C-terminal-related transcriptional regulator [Solirubrobacteraceae bacterium]|jgi:LuxR family maltose regulon positive regulatory protein|nr:LuxR C-terminal-related transcriptional regulator [Solirubrobacteraceae bacterium]
MQGATTLAYEPLPAPTRLRFGADLPDPKFRAPVMRAGAVRRAGLLGRLEQESDRPLILLSAPAGYGKTTFLTQWAQEYGWPCAWLTLDGADADPGVLLDSITHAMTAIGAEPGLRRSFGLILDDAHVLPAAVLRDAVLDILGWLPAGSQLAVSSRCEPALALGRMRAEGVLSEVHSEDLSMSLGEATDALRRSGSGPRLTRARTLVHRAEGWPVALALAGAWARSPESSGSGTRLSGDDHVFAEYFRAEILASLPKELVRFLTRSSVLERLSGSLCDAVLGCRRSAAVLAQLARLNVPLCPLDSRHEWYRLQGLFREMLQTELRRSEPEVEAVLHRRAADWYRRAGDIDRALDHTTGAEDLNGTGELLWENLLAFLGRGRNDVVQRWLSGVSVEGFSGSARLALAAAHSNLSLGRVAVAEQWARYGAVRMSHVPEESGEAERAAVLIVDAWGARAGASNMGRAAAEAYDLLSDDSPWRASCCFLRGTAALLTGDEAEAERRLEEGAVRGAVLAPDAASLCLAQLAVAAGERDQMEAAADLAERARVVVAEHGLGATPASALVFAVGALAAMREGRVDEATAAAARCQTLLDPLDDSRAWFGAETRILLARVSLALGHVSAAREQLADASRLARRTADVVVFGRWFAAAWDQFDARAENALTGVGLLTNAELRVLRFLPTHYSFHEIAQRLHVSSNTVKTHVHAVYRKLDACSRSEAVAHATSAGLLGG